MAGFEYSRKFSRLPIGTHAYVHSSKLDRLVQMSVWSLGLGGAGLETVSEDDLYEGDELKILLNLPGEPELTFVKAKVVWRELRDSTGVGAPMRLRVGVEFGEMRMGDLKALKKFMERHDGETHV